MSRVLPILFNTDMVRAILDGRKTVTRRICKDANEYTIPDMSFYDAKKRTYAVHNYSDKEHTEKLSIIERTCPICPGDILYVRETWSPVFVVPRRYLYKVECKEAENLPIKWHPSIHMPKEAARIWLNVKDVRVERLQFMSWDAICNEGIIPDSNIRDGFSFRMLQNKFKNLWDSTIKKSDLDRYGWDANPYVFVIEFMKIDKPEEI